MKRIPQLAILVVALLGLFNPFFVDRVLAVNEYPITGLRDFYFTLVENSEIEILGNTNETCAVVTTDPMLWVYDSEDVIVVFDDDSNYRLPDGQPNPDQLNQCVSSKIKILLPAGNYRLRSGYWISPNNPDFVPTITDRWDLTYTVVTDLVLTDTITPPTTTTTTEVTTSLPAEVSTTTTQAELPTTTLPEEPTWPPTTESTPPITTSTTTVPTTDVPVTEPPTSSTDVPTTVVPATTTEPPTTEPVTVPATDPPTTDTPTTIEPELPSDPPTTPPEAPETTLPPEIPSETAEAILDDIGEEPLTEEQFADVIESLTSGDLTQDEIEQIVEALLDTEITEDQATDLATNAEILETVTADQATDIFDAIVISELTDEEAAEIIEAVQDAPSEVREAFEEEINVFDGTFDTYTPLGSAIPVSTRRTVTAAIAAIGITTPISSRKKTK